jgi:hypothetical protein
MSSKVNKKNKDKELTNSKKGDTKITTSKKGDTKITTSKKGDTKITTSKKGDTKITASKKITTSMKKQNNAIVNTKDSHNNGQMYSKWLIKNHQDTYFNFNMPAYIKEHLQNIGDNLYYGALNRINTMAIFGYRMDLNIVDMICTTFKMKDLTDGTEAIFGFGYSEMLDPKRKIVRKSGINPIGSNVIYRYFTTGGSFVSKDGEYRLGFIAARTLHIIERTPGVKSLYEEITKYLSEKIVERKFLLFKEYFYPTDDKRQLQNELEYVYSTDIQKFIFTITWFTFMNNSHLGITENHLNEKFKKMMSKHLKEDLVFYRSLLGCYSDEIITQMRSFASHMFMSNGRDQGSTTKIGQKIIPLNISEAQHPFNLRYKPWREYLISLKLSDMVVNNVSPGFFITNSWFYIKNSRKGLFDNEIQYEKMERSDSAIEITNLLLRAQIYTHNNLGHSSVLTDKKRQKTDKRIMNSWLSDKFKHLYDKIQDPIDFAKEDIIMSNVALCLITEYVGRTLMDVLSISKTSTYYNDLIGHPFSQKGFPIFSKYIFEICYNLLVMNQKLGVIHGDLHLNNATLKPMVYKRIKDIKNVKNPQVMYALDDKDEQYIFPTAGYHVCIIDFSRSIVMPENVHMFHDTALPKSYTTINRMKDFQYDQVDRLVKMYIHYTSDSDSKKDELLIIFKNHFEAVFKLLSVLDLYGITQKLEIIFTNKSLGCIAPHKLCIDLVKKVNKYAEYYLTTEMNKLLADITYEKTILADEWPIAVIIKKCFYENLTKNIELGQLIDVYYMNHDIKYSLNTHKQFPPSIKEPKYIEDGKEYPVKFLKPFEEGRKMFEKEKDNGMKIINYIAIRQKQKHL